MRHFHQPNPSSADTTVFDELWLSSSAFYIYCILWRITWSAIRCLCLSHPVWFEGPLETVSSSNVWHLALSSMNESPQLNKGLNHCSTVSVLRVLLSVFVHMWTCGLSADRNVQVWDEILLLLLPCWFLFLHRGAWLWISSAEKGKATRSNLQKVVVAALLSI